MSTELGKKVKIALESNKDKSSGKEKKKKRQHNINSERYSNRKHKKGWKNDQRRNKNDKACSKL